MPKHDLILRPGEEIPETFKPALLACFKPAELEKLFKHGGLVRLSIAAPYSPTKGPTSRKRHLDGDVLAEIETLKEDPEKLDMYLSSFTSKALLDLCAKIGFPISKSSNARELKAQLVTTFRAGEIWNKIAGHQSTTASSERTGPS
ncbi:MAG: hypothetical protein AAB676_16430 [Verrucomicrobiota bacterium]